jgi:N-acetylglucosaminyldiphosphoundecaprenol N-acetyl-beta-D-mannosaminyltransferase
LSRGTRLSILINGWYGHWNAGDDAILQVFVEQAIERLDCDIVVLSELPENIPQSSRVGSAFHLPVSIKGAIKSLFDGSFYRHLRHIWKCDLFVLGGGGLLRDNTTWRNLIRLLDEIWFSKLFGRKVMLYAIGVGPFKSRLGKFLIRASVNMCDLITVRSEGGAQLLREIGIAPERIHVVADPAFLLKPAAPVDQEFIRLLSGGKKIGVFPTISLVSGEQDFSHVHRIAAALDRLVEEEGLQFVALPMRVRDSGLDDVKISLAIKTTMKHPEALDVYEKRLTPSELKWATSKNMMNITVRLHAMIFSLGAKVPVVAINYEPKVANVFSALQRPQYLVEMDNRLDTALVDSVKQCLNDLPQYRQRIIDIGMATESSAARTFELMQSLHTAKQATNQAV